MPLPELKFVFMYRWRLVDSICLSLLGCALSFWFWEVQKSWTWKFDSLTVQLSLKMVNILKLKPTFRGGQWTNGMLVLFHLQTPGLTLFVRFLWAFTQWERSYSPSQSSWPWLILRFCFCLSKPAHQVHEDTEPDLFRPTFMSLPLMALKCLLRCDQSSVHLPSLFLSLTKRIYLQNKCLINPVCFADLLSLSSEQLLAFLCCPPSLISVPSIFSCLV